MADFILLLLHYAVGGRLLPEIAFPQIIED
jgi:hypothetical protein